MLTKNIIFEILKVSKCIFDVVFDVGFTGFIRSLPMLCQKYFRTRQIANPEVYLFGSFSRYPCSELDPPPPMIDYIVRLFLTADKHSHNNLFSQTCMYAGSLRAKSVL